MSKSKSIKVQPSHVGGYRSDSRVHGVVTLRVLSLPKDTIGEIRQMLAEKGEKEYETLTPEAIAVGVASDGKVYGICSEGVGWEVTDEERLVIDVHGSNETSFSMFPVACIKMGKAEVLAACEGGEEVDLADWVRAFGDRLETNFGIWFRTLQAKGEVA